MNKTIVNEIARELVKHLPKSKFTYEKKWNGLLLTIDNTEKIFIKETDTWELVKQKIDKRFAMDNFECGICDEDSPMMTCCIECNNKICYACYLILTIENDGLCICSFCRCSSGEFIEGKKMSCYINELLQRIPNEKYYYEAQSKIQKHCETNKL